MRLKYFFFFFFLNVKFIKMSNVDKVVLDVGGVVFHTRKSTLINGAHPSAFFESLLSNEED